MLNLEFVCQQFDGFNKIMLLLLLLFLNVLQATPKVEGLYSLLLEWKHLQHEEYAFLMQRGTNFIIIIILIMIGSNKL